MAPNFSTQNPNPLKTDLQKNFLIFFDVLFSWHLLLDFFISQFFFPIRFGHGLEIYRIWQAALAAAKARNYCWIEEERSSQNTCIAFSSRYFKYYGKVSHVLNILETILHTYNLWTDNVFNWYLKKPWTGCNACILSTSICFSPTKFAQENRTLKKVRKFIWTSVFIGSGFWV